MTSVALLKASPLRPIIILAWCIMLGFVVSFVVPSARDVFTEFTGHFLWVPYLWIAGLLWWKSDTREERGTVVSFTRVSLLIAMAAGVADLALVGWSGDPTSSITRASPWRFTGYWVLSIGLLAWLGRPRMRNWIAAGAAKTSGEP